MMLINTHYQQQDFYHLNSYSNQYMIGVQECWEHTFLLYQVIPHIMESKCTSLKKGLIHKWKPKESVLWSIDMDGKL